jgi:hypothetical protein
MTHLLCAFLPGNPHYGVGRNHGSHPFSGRFLLNRSRPPGAERATQRVRYSISDAVCFAARFSIGFSDADAENSA